MSPIAAGIRKTVKFRFSVTAESITEAMPPARITTLCSLRSSEPTRRGGGTVSTACSGASTAAASGSPDSGSPGSRAGVPPAAPEARARIVARSCRASSARRYARRTADWPASATSNLQFSQSEDPCQQGLHDVDRLHPVQPGLPLLLEQETGVDAHVAAGHLVAGEVPAQDVAENGQQHQGAAAEQQPGRPSGQPLVKERAALQEPFETVASKKEQQCSQRHPAADKG